MGVTTKVEALGDVMARQSVQPAWMRALMDSHGPAARVVVTTKVTPFGNFVVSIEPEPYDPCEVDGCSYDEENVCRVCGGQASCDNCPTDAVVQTDWDGFLCQDHLDQAWESHLAELAYDSWKEDQYL